MSDITPTLKRKATSASRPKRQRDSTASHTVSASGRPSRKSQRHLPPPYPDLDGFFPDAIRLYVLEEPTGLKRLVPTKLPGTRHWRSNLPRLIWIKMILIQYLTVGDPNVNYCCSCHGVENIRGCKTCKRSYHLACALPSAEVQNGDGFYCPLCVDRGWHVSPPEDVLPLSPTKSQPESAPSDPVTPGLERPTSEVIRSIVGTTEAASVESSSNKGHLTGRIVSRSLPQFDITPSRDSPVSVQPYDTSETLPSNLEAAILLLRTELRSAVGAREQIPRLQDRVRVLEQQLSIQNGRLALIRQDVKAEFDSELKMVRQELAAKEHCVQQLTDENRSLQHQLEESKKLSESRAKEIENWRKHLMDMLGLAAGGNPP
jgi:hypothetical protein